MDGKNNYIKTYFDFEGWRYFEDKRSRDFNQKNCSKMNLQKKKIFIIKKTFWFFDREIFLTKNFMDEKLFQKKDFWI